MGRTEPDYNPSNHFASGTLLASFLSNFHYGRTTAKTCDWNTERIPKPNDGCDGLKSIFIDNIYANDAEPWKSVAAISGAHTLGRAHPEYSGFDGFWASEGQQGIFNNNYYRNIITKGWGPEFDMGGVPGRNQWKRVDKGAGGAHKEMMLDTDMCLFHENNRELSECKAANILDNQVCLDTFKDSGKPILASRGNCCVWNYESHFYIANIFKLGEPNEFCGVTITEPNISARRTCCANIDSTTSYGDCDDADLFTGAPARKYVVRFAKDNALWLNEYSQAWWTATRNGYDNLIDVTPTGRRLTKLGDDGNEPLVESALIEETNDFIQP